MGSNQVSAELDGSKDYLLRSRAVEYCPRLVKPYDFSYTFDTSNIARCTVNAAMDQHREEEEQPSRVNGRSTGCNTATLLSTATSPVPANIDQELADVRLSLRRVVSILNRLFELRLANPGQTCFRLSLLSQCVALPVSRARYSASLKPTDN